MSEKIAWGVFKGLFAFFILLPICLIAGCLTLAAIMSQSEKAERQKAEAEKQIAESVRAAREIELQKKRDAELELRNEQLLQEAKAQQGAQAEQIRVQKAKQLENLFSLRKQRALQGAADACFDVGMMYLKGEGTETNLDLGLKYIKIAAQNGYGSAVEFMKSYDSRQ